MKYQDIVSEAHEHGITVDERKNDVYFYGQDHRASMFRIGMFSGGRTWRAVSTDAMQQRISFDGTKAKAADWCLDQVVNGPA